MSKLNNLTGEKFTRLTVISRAGNKNKSVRWNCLCVCGNKTIVESYALTTGQTKSCGCYNRDKITKYPKIKYEGTLIPITSHPLFATYHGMKNRCYNKKLPNYDKWGGRGIRMSKTWFNSFHKFVNDMGNKPTRKHSVERRNNDKGYNKFNCYWATAKEQGNNQRSNIKIEYNGKIKTLAQVSEETGINYHTFYGYFVRKGITDVDLIVSFLKHKTARRVTRKELNALRQVQHLLQDELCPILKMRFPAEDMVVDHLHKKHAKYTNESDQGLIRGVIHRQANSFEGKVANLMIRLGMHKFNISLPELLRNTADYLEHDPLPFLHPSEAPKTPILTRSSYNKLKKAYTGKAKFPEYRTRTNKNGTVKNVQKLTKPLEKLFIEYNIGPGFYK